MDPQICSKRLCFHDFLPFSKKNGFLAARLVARNFTRAVGYANRPLSPLHDIAVARHRCCSTTRALRIAAARPRGCQTYIRWMTLMFIHILYDIPFKYGLMRVGDHMSLDCLKMPPRCFNWQ